MGKYGREVERASGEWGTLTMALAKVPIHLLGVHVQAVLHQAYETPLEGVYQVFIGYDVYALSGVMFMHQPAMMLYLDYNSTLCLMQVAIQQALQEYNATASPFYRGV